MQNLAATKAAIMVSPQSATDPTESYVDTLGFDSALVLISLGATGASGISALKLQESDASGSGYTDIVDFDGDATYTDIEGSTLALPGAGNDDEVWVVHIDLRGRKRYLKCVVDSATNASVLGVTAVLGRAGESIATNAGHTSSTVGGAGVFVEI
jgi:hypothetical protein